jgi:hypothetical protein
MTETYSLKEVCDTLGKSVPYIRNLQAQLGLYVMPRGERYPECYAMFLRKLVALRTFNVSYDDIGELFAKERKILELLHVDAISDAPLWYLATVESPARSDRHLLLTGQDLGFPISAEAIQCNLDFRERPPELFRRHEMGEDVRRVLDLYLKLLRRIDARVRIERPVLIDALAWVGNGLLPE